MEEYRGNRNATGRMQDAHWTLMMEGSKVECSLAIQFLLRQLYVYALALKVPYRMPWMLFLMMCWLCILIDPSCVLFTFFFCSDLLSEILVFQLSLVTLLLCVLCCL